LPNANTLARQQRKIAFLKALFFRACNGLYLIDTAENHWRASLVPAAAVIPAPKAYTNVAVVKKPVVGFETIVWDVLCGLRFGVGCAFLPHRQSSETCGIGHWWGRQFTLSVFTNFGDLYSVRCARSCHCE